MSGTVPVGVEAVALEVENGVHHVLHHLRPCDRSRLGDMSHDKDGDAGALGKTHQPARALLHLVQQQ